MGKKSKYRLLSLATALSIILTGLGGASLISAAETESYGGGSGTELDPYIISSAEHMAQLDADTVAGNTDGKYYKLTADITLSGDFTIGQNRESKTSIASASGANSFVTDVKPFEGVFDGNFHTVTYTYSDCYAYGGLFSYLEGAEVKNLVVKGTSTGANLIFGSVAAVINNSVIDNCISEVEITDARKYTAGIAAIVQDSQITNTENRGCVVTRKDAAGATDSDVSHGSINNHLKTLFSTKNENTVQGGHSNVGGIAAVVLGDVTFENVLNSGDVTNSADNGCVSHTGGIVGIIMNSKNGNDPGGTVIFNYVGNTGDITCGKTNRNNTNDRTGGIYGELENSYYHCNVVWNTGTITSLKSDGTNHNQTGSIGGATGGTCATIDVNNPHILYSKIGTVSGFTGNQCSVEFTGKGMHLPQEIYYEGDAYVPANNATKVDMKTDADFIEQLGSGWRAVDGYAYPTLAYHFTVGDFNNDGAFDIRDLISLKKYLTGVGTGTDIVPAAADFDENGVVESTDLASVRKLLFGLSLKDVSASASKVLRVYSHNVCSHGDTADSGVRAAEIAAMSQTISDKAFPTVVAGDFNAEYSEFSTNLSGLTRIAEGRAFDKATWLDWDSAGASAIDHILYSTDSFDARFFYVLDQKAGDTVLSDHCALLAELEIK